MGDAMGWTGAALFGLPGSFDHSVEPGLSGLCMTVDGPTAEAVTWISPDRTITLKDLSAYRVTVTAATGQLAPDAIPFWDLTYDNFIIIPSDSPAPFIRHQRAERIHNRLSRIGLPSNRKRLFVRTERRHGHSGSAGTNFNDTEFMQ